MSNLKRAFISKNTKDIDDLRSQRESECFPIINRGKLWYDGLTEKQYKELEKWYKDWLKATDTKVKPNKPEWLV
jgi:hypothetical protein